MPTIKVNGMSCNHCKAAVEKGVRAIAGIKSAEVDLDKKELHYESEDASSPVPVETVINVVEELGYEPAARG